MNRRLKSLRKAKGFCQIQVQMKTGIDQSDYSKIETGKRYPTVQQLIELAKIYGTSMDYICGLTDEINPYPRK